MARATLVPITGPVLEWAMEQAGVDDREVARRCSVPQERVTAWRVGEEQPTKTQFTKLVNTLRRPSMFFFLPSPPETPSIPPAFRHPPGKQGDRALLPSEATALRTARRIQRVTAWIREQHGDQPPVLPEISPNMAPEKAAADVAHLLGWTLTAQLDADNVTAVAKELRLVLEDYGLTVLQLSLGTDGCRGFSLYHPSAPLIAINSAYNNAARLYSYVHELGHLVTRSDSICVSPTSLGLERWCEEFAAAFLLPQGPFLEYINSAISLGSIDRFEHVQRIANKFKVSLRAVALRLIRLDRATWELYNEVDERAEFKRPGGGGRGETAPQKRLRQWGRTYSRLLLRAAEKGSLGRQDILEYLNLTNKQISLLEQELRSAKWDEA
jgi:Zn-dependent peptidase ImmA (M78 family)